MQKDSGTLSDKALRGFGSQTLIVIGIGVVNLIYFSVMSRLLSKEDFGYFAIITAITIILDEISSAGLGSAVIQRKKLEKDFFQSAFTLSILIGSIFTLLLFLLSGSLSQFYVGGATLALGFKIISVTFLSHNITSPIRALYVRDMRFLRYGSYQLATLILSYITGIVLAYKGMGFIAILVASTLAPLSLAITLLAVNIRRLGFCFNRIHFIEIFSYGGWLTASGIVRSIYDQLDKLITTKWISISLLGAYNRPVGFISQVSGQINGIFDTVLFPILSTCQDDISKMRRAYLLCSELIFVPAIIIAIGFILSSHLLIIVFLGDKWLDLVSVFRIASVTMVFMFHNRIGDCFFRSLGIVKEYFLVRVVVCVLSVVSIYWGSKYGIYGLVVSVMIAKIIEAIVKTVFFQLRLGFNYSEFFKGIIKVAMLPLMLFLFLMVVQSFAKSEFYDVLSLVLFLCFLAFSVKLRPAILGDNFNTYILKKYFKGWI